MIARSKNQISTINAVKYRNKINDALKLHRIGREAPGRPPGAREKKG